MRYQGLFVIIEPDFGAISSPSVDKQTAKKVLAPAIAVIKRLLAGYIKQGGKTRPERQCSRHEERIEFAGVVGGEYDIGIEAGKVFETLNLEMGEKSKYKAAWYPDTFLKEKWRQKIEFHIVETQ